jgi:hypothetical protein
MGAHPRRKRARTRARLCTTWCLVPSHRRHDAAAVACGTDETAESQAAGTGKIPRCVHMTDRIRALPENRALPLRFDLLTHHCPAVRRNVETIPVRKLPRTGVWRRFSTLCRDRESSAAAASWRANDGGRQRKTACPLLYRYRLTHTYCSLARLPPTHPHSPTAFSGPMARPARAPCSHPQPGPPDSATSPVIVLY